MNLGRQRVSVEPLALSPDFEEATVLAKELLGAGTATDELLNRLKKRFPNCDYETLVCALGTAMAEVRKPF